MIEVVVAQEIEFPRGKQIKYASAGYAIAEPFAKNAKGPTLLNLTSGSPREIGVITS